MALMMTLVEGNSYVVGAFEAKIHFSELLRKVQEGCSITITKNGHEVAVIENREQRVNTRAQVAWAQMCSIGKPSAKQSHVSIEEILQWKNKGRKP